MFQIIFIWTDMIASKYLNVYKHGNVDWFVKKLPQGPTIPLLLFIVFGCTKIEKHDRGVFNKLNY